ncbi:DUF2946 family protein [Phenylobacterium sp.]|uniref:DUF2946 family protein n=1 Tax=Phenylobacterium sp. TaxID=1871053 RepID=UPI002730D2B1|nr:DUF2946 family protein [Phenylobacterium sp.]MDP1616159.1 hypothetical protein [Phenylobacterium sp.]MDP1986056.1 hypothetical protein [Phenylobacterium sp.]
MLAVLAIMMKIMVPPGFMLGSPTDDLSSAITICTSQGAVTLPATDLSDSADGGDPDRSPFSLAHDGPCTFSGHGAGGSPPAGDLEALASRITRRAAPAFGVVSPEPSLARAGPPLPARGPPFLAI